MPSSEPSHLPQPLAVWGGIEGTYNRVGNDYIDQLRLTGHYERDSDLELIAKLGISALRYPVLWEQTAPDGPERALWQWPDLRLHRLRELGIRPIVGLVHHGSGPPHTNLTDPGFATGLAEYAGAVARRYPWLEDFTPVNEPLTTARFSGLYGLWHPHARDNRTFATILLNQCRAVVLSMKAIREVIPHARLVQSEEIGPACGTPSVQGEVDHQNDRRWLTFDILCGRIDSDHPLWPWLTQSCGVPEAELRWFQEYPCPPDIMGIDYYLSSERFLDEDLDRYPAYSHSGNGTQRYANDLTARVRFAGLRGPVSLMQETWQRYGLPLALTEVHNGCTREEQMRWLAELWQAAHIAHDAGIDVRAVTAWALLGLHGWDRLVTGGGRYEVGVFDARGAQPRPTIIAEVVRSMALGRTPEHPLLDVPGWWRRPDRYMYGFARTDAGLTVPADTSPTINEQFPHVRPLLLCSAIPVLGAVFAQVCERRGIPFRLLPCDDWDMRAGATSRLDLAHFRPWGVVHIGAPTVIDGTEAGGTRVPADHTGRDATLASLCTTYGVPMVTISPAVTSRDAVLPEGEQEISLCVWDNVTAMSYHPFETSLPDLVDAVLDGVIDGELGHWHLVHGPESRIPALDDALGAG